MEPRFNPNLKSFYYGTECLSGTELGLRILEGVEMGGKRKGYPFHVYHLFLRKIKSNDNVMVMEKLNIL